jgi:hypothetical protein
MNLFVMMTAAVMCASIKTTPAKGPSYLSLDPACDARISFTTNRAKAKKALEDGARVWGIALCPEIQIADRYVGYCKRGFFNVSELTRTSSTTYRVEEKAVEVE